MRSIDYMNRVEAYVNRLNSERRTVLETITQVRFLDLMADELNCNDTATDYEEEENKKYGVAPNLDAAHTRGYAKRQFVLEDCSNWPVFSCADTWGGPDYHGIFAFSVKITEQMKGRIIGFSLDAGADDFNEEEDCYEILTSPEEFDAVNQALADAGVTFASAEVTMIPQTTVDLTSEDDIKKMNRILGLLDEDDDVQNVYHNWNEPEEDEE